MTVVDTTVTDPLIGGSFVGKNIKDFLHGKEYNKYKKRFRKCLESGEPQKVEYHINSEYMMALLIRHGREIVAHEASRVDLTRRDETLFLLKREAVGHYHRAVV